MSRRGARWSGIKGLREREANPLKPIAAKYGLTVGDYRKGQKMGLSPEETAARIQKLGHTAWDTKVISPAGDPFHTKEKF